MVTLMFFNRFISYCPSTLNREPNYSGFVSIFLENIYYLPKIKLKRYAMILSYVENSHKISRTKVHAILDK